MTFHADTSGRWALVTGAAQRLGREIALALARQGWHVAVHYHRSADTARRTVAELQALGVCALAVAQPLDEPGAAD
ncbi:MAG: SDR family NAD(P)-dependent oxidoreductase, partial [Tepidimonas sp.]|uniref:SDR family NAD(P)-dependent oxidoreductase n=1 Tax=Tepidimonas sp. TaxID=2002775 RepID=UPI004054C5D4